MLNQSSIFVVVVVKTCTFFLKIIPSMTNAKFSDLEIGFEWKKRRGYFVKSVNCFFFSSADYLLFLHQGDFTLKKKKENSRETNLRKEEESGENLETLAHRFFSLWVFLLPTFFFPPLYIIFHSDRVRISLRRVDHRHVVSFSLARMRQRRFHPGMNWNYSRG